MTASRWQRQTTLTVKVQAESELLSGQTFVFLLGHIPLAFLLATSGFMGLVHAGLVLLFGIRAALRQQTSLVLATISYIVGAEILWRMTEATIFWEFGKYAIVLLVLTAVFGEKRTQRLTSSQSVEVKLKGVQRNFNPVPLFYLAFLLPAIILTWSARDFSAVRDAVSFNLSGALVLAFLLIYLWRRSVDQKNLTMMMIALVGPIIGILTRAVYFTLTRQVTFNLEANFVTSGGYGPNQVSSILGLGALACVILLLFARRQQHTTVLFGLLAAAFLFQAFLTFSRGGVYSFLLAISILGLFLFRHPQMRTQFMVLALLGLFLSTLLIVPGLNQVTAEIWQDRFTDLETTGRLELVQADWQAFQEHPFTGVGVGMSDSYHTQVLGRRVVAHTEFSRILAEHGFLGIISLVLLFSLLIQSIWQTKSGLSRALTIALMVWGFSIMLHSAMRFAAISYVLALVVIAWELQPIATEPKQRTIRG